MSKRLLFLCTTMAVCLLCFSKTHAQNTQYGTGALVSNTTGTFNTALGYRAMYNNTTGGYNTAVGYTLYSNTTGHNNVAVGHASLFYNINGYHNTALGSGALTYNTSGYQNMAVGMYSLHYNTSGYQNTANGAFALYSNQTGSGNTASGYQSLYSNYNGTGNTATGFTALYANTGGNYNTATGYWALNHNTTGSSNAATGVGALVWNTTGNNNAAHGTYALYNNTKGNSNAAFGYEALFTDTVGGGNTAVGAYALYAITKNSKSTALGYNAGNLYNYSACTFLGAHTSTSVGGLSNVTVVGYKATATGSNQVRIGNTSVTSIGGPVGWSTISDGRYKNQLQEDVPGLAFINKLRPISYHLDVEKIDQAHGANEVRNSQSQMAETASAEEQNARKQQAKVKYTGFVAQEVEKAAKELNYDFSGVDKPKNEQDLYGLRYEVFVVPLVKAVQELSEKDKEIDVLKARIDKLEDLVSRLANGQAGSVTTSLSSLEQNTPNPVQSTTAIRYHISETALTAKLDITNAKGQVIKTMNISKGTGQVNLNIAALAAGTYNYTLYVDGKQVDSKRLVITR